MRGIGAVVFGLVIVIRFWGTFGTATNYSTYYGTPLTDDDMAQHIANGTTGNCTIEVAACDENEGRRVDGTCNNLQNPTLGGSFTPYYRMLEPEFNKVSETEYEPALSKTGSPKPLARELRTLAFSEGYATDDELSILVTHMAISMAVDISSSQDTSNYVSNRPHCCMSAGKSDYMCTPNKVPLTDPVHRFSGQTCLNHTRPISYQIAGCIPKSIPFERVVATTPLYDLSNVYGNSESKRTYSGGLLMTEVYNGVVLPVTSGMTFLLGINYLGIIFFWRYHNHIASRLAEVNPDWDDDKLFTVARDINIAVSNNIQLYELFTILMGKDYLIEQGVILENTQMFRDIYDETVKPQLALEYPMALRFMHGMQSGVLRMYDAEGIYQKQYPTVNLTSNIDYLKEENVMAQFAQGMIRQPCGKSDLVADPDVVEIGLGSLQRTHDIMTNDLSKSRYNGFPGYIKYIEYCFGHEIESFDDLVALDFVDREMVERMKVVYGSVSDIDFLFGLWVEKKKDGVHFPPTMNCVVSKHLLHNIKSDRHWHERQNRPNAFTWDQLQQIRKVQMARVICDIGDTITRIQPAAFKIPGPNNQMVSCDQIPDLDYTAWAEC